MKKLLLIGAFALSIFGVSAAQAAYSSSYDNWSTNQPYTGYNAWNTNQPYSASNWSGRDGCGGDDCGCPADERVGGCYCQYVHYQPRYYTTKRCIEECYSCPRRCCRYVPQYYEVQRCRYVPEYYTETRCCQVPEYYEVQDCKTCKRVICEPQCEYIPCYYWKYECK